MRKRSSLLFIFITYVIVIGLSIFLYTRLDITNKIVKVLVVDLFATLLIWIISLFVKNASLYDPYWSVIPPVIVLALMIENNNFSLRMILLFVGILIWAIRLTYNWGKLWSDFKHQDWRYNNIKSFSPKLYFLTSLLGIMVFPTLIVFAQLIGTIQIANNQSNPGILSYIGLIIIVVATTIQFLADSHMQKFKKDSKNSGKIIDEGLWKYSRHPNYFGEILVWFGVYLFYADVFGINYLIIAPLLMTIMFLFVSIPMMEKKILKTRAIYKEYQQNVSVLIPLPRKK